MKTAFVFPGQGSQVVGMGLDLAQHHRVARDLFDEADEAVGFPLSTLCFEGPEAELQLTENTQPAVLAASIAVLRVLESEGGPGPTALAGHSLGEYTALVASGALSFGDAVRAVRARGRFMQEAVPPGDGAMVAVIGLDRKAVEAICQEAAEDEVLFPANFNAPGQIVISGHVGAADRAVERAREAGARTAIRLKVSAPFHCPLMNEAGIRLAEVLAEIPFQHPEFPVISNVEARPVESIEEIRKLLVRQVSSPVRWEESVLAMAEDGIERFIEIGPGRVLTGLTRRIVPKAERLNVDDLKSLETVLARCESSRS